MYEMHYYTSVDNTLEEIEVKEYSLSELVRLMDENGKRVGDIWDMHEQARKKCRDMVQEMTSEDFHTHSDKYNEYKQFDREFSDLGKRYDLATISQKGIIGALRYAVAKEVDNAITAVMPVYAMKKAGPKTRAKFWESVEHWLTVPGINVRDGEHDVVHVHVGRVHIQLYMRTDFTIGDNRFNSEFHVCPVTDAWEGMYPVDWDKWSAHVIEQNKRLEEEFEEFCKKQESTVHGLKIGDVEFNRVHAYAMKKEG